MLRQARNTRSGRTLRGATRAAAALALLLTTIAGLAIAQTDRADREVVRLVLAPESRLWLEGTSNVHDWSCDAGAIEAELQVRTADAMPAGSSLPDAIDRVTVSVPVTEIDCGNGTMEGKLREALKAEEHPEITFRMDDYAIIPDSADPGRMLVGAQGTLTVAGVDQPIQLSVLGRDTGEGGIRITGSAQILMSRFEVEPPTAMFGLLKTDERVLVRFDLVTSYDQIAADLAASGWTLAARPRR